MNLRTIFFTFVTLCFNHVALASGGLYIDTDMFVGNTTEVNRQEQKLKSNNDVGYNLAFGYELNISEKTHLA